MDSDKKQIQAHARAGLCLPQWAVLKMSLPKLGCTHGLYWLFLPHLHLCKNRYSWL